MHRVTMEEVAAHLRSLLFSEDGRDVSPAFKKYYQRVVSRREINWDLFGLENESPAYRFLAMAGWGYERILKKLERALAGAPKEQKRAERIADLISGRQKDGRPYAYIWGTILGYMRDAIRRLDPHKKFYHKLQIKIVKLKPDKGIFPLELHEGEGKRYYSTVPTPDRDNVHDTQSASYRSLRQPEMPAEFFLSELYTREKIGSDRLSALASFYHADIIDRWPPFGGKPCFIAIAAFACWLASYFPDLEGELRQKQALEDEPVPNAEWVEDFSLAEAHDLDAFERYCEELWKAVPEKHRPAVCALLWGWLCETERRVSDTAMANSISWSPQRFKYAKDKLLDPHDETSGILRTLWAAHLTDFLENLGIQHLYAFMIYFYEFCTNKCG